MILSFYLGVALGLAIFFSKAPVLREARPGDDVWYQANASLLVASVLMLAAAVVGARVVFSIPLEIRANWIFRVSPLPGVPQCLSAARRTMYCFAIVPVWSVSAVTLFWLWPLRYALEHLIILCLFAAIIAELCLCGFQKVPFTCSYPPGKTNMPMLWAGYWLAFLIYAFSMAKLESWMLRKPARLIVFYLVAGILFAGFEWWRRKADSVGVTLIFEDAADPAVLTLGLGEIAWTTSTTSRSDSAVRRPSSSRVSSAE